MLSIDDKFDPEKGIEITYFVLISRLVSHKDNFGRYLNWNRAALKMEIIQECIDLLMLVDLRKES